MTEGALVLEGGSLRALFTSGVLDVFMEKGIELSYVNGVSAGSMCGMNYISKQIGRTYRVNLEFLHDRRYISVWNMLKKREIFNFDFLFGELSSELIPFDWDTFNQSKQRFVAVATRCRTGETQYFEKGKCSDIVAAVQASSSMPVLSRMITVEGKKYLDGGMSMPIAYKQAMEEGYAKIVLILTRQSGYRKNAFDKWSQKAYERYFKPLPELLEVWEKAPERYNTMQEEIEDLEKSGRIFVIRPQEPVLVSRVEQDRRKLEQLYETGRKEAVRRMPELLEYLKK